MNKEEGRAMGDRWQSGQESTSRGVLSAEKDSNVPADALTMGTGLRSSHSQTLGGACACHLQASTGTLHQEEISPPEWESVSPYPWKHHLSIIPCPSSVHAACLSAWISTQWRRAHTPGAREAAQDPPLRVGNRVHHPTAASETSGNSAHA